MPHTPIDTMLNPIQLSSESNDILHKVPLLQLVQHLNALILVFEIDHQQIVAVNNLVWKQISNVSSIALNDFVNYVYPDDRADVLDYLVNYQEDKSHKKLYFRLLHNNGEYTSYKCVGNYNQEMHALLLTAVESDYFQLRHYRQMLESKVEALKESNRYLDEFAYIASHDLQEPLRKLSTYAGRLIDKLPSEGDFVPYTSRIQESTARMRTLIDDLLSFSRFAKQELKIEKVDLNEALNKAIEANELRINETKATIEKDQLPTVEGMFTQLQQLFFNLINNALKFIKSDANPVISIKHNLLTEEVREKLHLVKGVYHQITIDDNGIGFKQEFAEKIFKLFQRLNSKHEFGGTGIGLAICKRIVENHNGYINAVGKENRGARFIIVLPEKQP